MFSKWIRPLTLTFLVTSFISPVNARQEVPSEITDVCKDSISEGRRRLNDIRNMSVVEDYWIRIQSTDYTNVPSSNLWSYIYVIQGKGVSDVFSSPVFMKSISTDIIEQCQPASLVRFGLYASGVNDVYGLMPSGEVRQFRCLDSSSGWATRTPNWGENWC
ncbi:MAG: hypothetical protein SAL07_21365 [Oscillatoria sp. PMC 1051.18]|nr:hypothetical protein [Oscillatoria sp. PMC 1050.18]MEC5032456.1 hypothetical protein [Oscillatoria sp. PMC 1051.18]